MPQGKNQKRSDRLTREYFESVSNDRLTPKELRLIREYFESTSRVLSLEAIQHICRMLDEIKILRSEVRYLKQPPLRNLGVKHD